MENRYTSAIHTGKARTEEEDIDCLLFCFDILAHLVYDADQADIRFYESILALGIERLALGGNAIAGILRAAYKVSAWLEGVFCKVLESRFTDTAGRSYEYCDEVRWESGRDEKIG